MIDTRLTDTYIRHNHRQQDQVGHNDHGNPHTRSDRQFLNNANIDKEQRQEANRVTQESQHARHVQTTECMAGRLHRRSTFARFNRNAVNDLNTVADTNRKHQERYQNRIEINGETQQSQ